VPPSHPSTFARATATPAPAARRAYLVVLAGPHFGEMFRLEPGREMEIGRRPASDVFLQDAGVSRRHATILADLDGAVVRDLRSRNGTFVNGHPVSQARVSDGARIQLGATTTLRFAMSDATEAEFQRRIADAALRDPLTGIHNRAMFAERLAAELLAYHARPRPIALLALDIDRFKLVNDVHGHAGGDAVLKAVATAIRDAVPPEDVVARWGGEEFVVLLRDAPAPRAVAIAEGIRAATAASVTMCRSTPVRVTLSVGVAVLAPPRQVLPHAAERVLVETADRALYRAKNLGRDRVEAEEAGV
jgi:two-component system cell cycle response regulator